MHLLDIGKHAREADVLADLLDPSHPNVFDIPVPWQVDEIVIRGNGKDYSLGVVSSGRRKLEFAIFWLGHVYVSCGEGVVTKVDGPDDMCLSVRYMGAGLTIRSLRAAGHLCRDADAIEPDFPEHMRQVIADGSTGFLSCQMVYLEIGTNGGTGDSDQNC